MLTSLVKKIFGSKNDRELKRMGKQVKLINALEDEISSLSDTDLQAKTHEFKERLAAGATLDDILNEAFAVAR
jgi:preprotein translocase subunit SecA